MDPAGAGRTGAAGGRRPSVPATVPGTVHTDLLAAGLIPDPYLDENEAAVHGSGGPSWRYPTTLTPAAGRR